MDKIRVGIVGCGGMANGAHIPAYKLDNKRVQIVAFCDIIEERAIKAKKKFAPKAKTYVDFNDLMADENVDAVDICTPNYWHSRIAVAALNATGAPRSLPPSLN